MKLQIELDGSTYDVEVEIVHDNPIAAILPATAIADVPLPDSALKISSPRKKRKAREQKDENACRSPMCGIVVAVNVSAGQTVAADELVLVLEAMKMETYIRAPRAGVIKAVNIKPGDGVVTGQVMVEFE